MTIYIPGSILLYFPNDHKPYELINSKNSNKNIKMCLRKPLLII